MLALCKCDEYFMAVAHILTSEQRLSLSLKTWEEICQNHLLLADSSRSVWKQWGADNTAVHDASDRGRFFHYNAAVYILRSSDLFQERRITQEGIETHNLTFFFLFFFNLAGAQSGSEVIKTFPSKLIWIDINQKWLRSFTLLVDRDG